MDVVSSFQAGAAARPLASASYQSTSARRPPTNICGARPLAFSNNRWPSHRATCRSASRGQRRLCCVAALTEGADLPLGTKAPAFELPEPLTGQTVSSQQLSGASALLVIFMCNHCPFVKLLKDGLVSLANDYKDKGVQLVAISSNSVQTHPQDGPEAMAEDAKQFGYPFPYLYDEDQEVAKKYQALCTPEFFLFDKDQKLHYHGQFDDARPSNGKPVTGKDIRAALDNLLEGGGPIANAIPSIGCNIKWHPGKAPAYYS